MHCILIAEDEPRIAAFLEKGLKRSGFITDTVDTGGDVLKKMSAENFDLLLLDLGLPDVDGIEVLERMKQQGYCQPVIVLTARVIEPSQQQIIQRMDAEIVGKPFLMSDLVKKVRSLLESS